MGKRIEWIDNARGFCLLFVMAHHTALAEAWIVKVYLPIFLTLFFFISGFLFVNSDKDTSVSQKMLNILTSLLLPYCLYCVITAVFHLLSGGVEAFLCDIRTSVLGVKSWFISALVVTELLGVLTLINKKYSITLCVMYLLLSFAIYACLPYQEYFWNFRNAMFANVYFAIGMMCRYHNIVSHFIKNKVGFPLLCVYACLVMVDITDNVNEGNFNETFSNYPFFIMESLFGISGFIWLCSKINRGNKSILFIGTNSLLYYYFQSVFIRITMTIFRKLGLHTSNTVDMCLVLLITYLGIAVLVNLINKHFPVFSGKYRIIITGHR